MVFVVKLDTFSGHQLSSPFVQDDFKLRYPSVGRAGLDGVFRHSGDLVGAEKMNHQLPDPTAVTDNQNFGAAFVFLGAESLQQNLDKLLTPHLNVRFRLSSFWNKLNPNKPSFINVKVVTGNCPTGKCQLCKRHFCSQMSNRQKSKVEHRNLSKLTS